MTSAVIWVVSGVSYILTAYKNNFITVIFQPESYKSVFSEYERLNQDYTAVVLLSILWNLNCLTMCSLYNNYKGSLKLKRKTRKGLALVLILMVFAFTFSLSPTIYKHVFNERF